MTAPVTYLDDDSGKIQLYPDWYENSEELFHKLQRKVEWQSRQIQLFGRLHSIPREEAWIAERGINYTYSKKTYFGAGWQNSLSDIAQGLHRQFNWQPNGALLNYYRNGSDKMGWHADNEPELGSKPCLAILSLGGARDIHFRHVDNKDLKLKVNLSSGSLLWMEGATQNFWQHSLPKRARAEARISCTFRRIEML